MKYGKSISWTEQGSVKEVVSSGHDTPEEALAAAIKIAKQWDWPGPPKWWQFWRSGDTNIEMGDANVQ